MLEFLKVESPDQIKSVLKKFDPQRDTWIVSDLKSKQEIQNEAIKKHSYYTDESILRVSDFWRLWIRRLDPTLNVVSSDFIRSLVQTFADIHGPKLDLLESEVSTLYKAVQEFAPIILHPASNEILQEWLSEEYLKNKLHKKWQKWFQIAQVCIRYIIQEHHAIDSKWSAAYLQSCELEKFFWPRKIFVDLGSELTSVEMGLLKLLSQKQEVVILAPEPVWKHKFENLLRSYVDSYGYGRIKESYKQDVNPIDQKQFIRLSTQLSEVKYATFKIREWLDQGAKYDQIAIISSDIERYWPVLQIYLDQEGIPYSKDTVARLNSLGDVQNLIAELKNFSSDVSWDSLEKSLFSRFNEQTVSYEKFKGLFYQLYDEDDLSRDVKIKELFYKKSNFSDEISQDDFLSFLVKLWINLPNSNLKSDLFESIFKDIISQSLNIKMKLSRWVSFFKNRLGSKEINIQKGHAEGVQIVSLMSAHLIECSNKIYIGLNEELYNKKEQSLMSLSDANAIKNQFDLAIDCSEESYLDFNLRWQALSAGPNVIFTSAHLSFESDPLNASLFFLENSPKSEEQIPQPIRADEIQRALINKTENIFKGAHSSFKRIAQDLNGGSVFLDSQQFKSLSASDLENYSKCSFKLLASKGFRLRDYSQTGIDLDNRDKGSLAHSLFEFIIKKLQLALQLSEIEIEQFLDSIRTERRLFVNQDSFWQVQKKRFLKIARQFIEFESERIKIFSSEVEKELTIYFDLNQLAFKLIEPEINFKFRLRIDRIDTHREKKYQIIYDYKSSAASIDTAKNWLTKNQFQMLLYLTAVRMTDSRPDDIKGALYYFYKSFDLNRGIIDRDLGINDFAMSSRNSSLYDTDKFANFNEEFVKLVSTILIKLNTGEFEPKPFDIKICDDCDWRKICRAPHMN